MCSFLVTNKEIQNLEYVNFYSKFRGPDLTIHKKINNINFVHNLLSITGNFTEQPFIDDDIVCVYNGEIYNYQEFNLNKKSDGEILIPLYKEYGMDFIKKLDGEFSIVIVDFKKNIILLSTDIFETKPLFVVKNGNYFGAASLKSSLSRLGFEHIKEVRGNHYIIYDLLKNEVLEIKNIHRFSVDNQHKDSFDDFNYTFEESIRKRTSNLKRDNVNTVLAMSEGYDSGAICCEFINQDFNFDVFTVKTQDKYSSVIDMRHNINNVKLPLLDKNGTERFLYPNIPTNNKKIIELTPDLLLSAKENCKKIIEDYTYFLYSPNNLKLIRKKMHDDSEFGKLIAYIVLPEYKKRNFKVFFSGCGGDGLANKYNNIMYKNFNNSIYPCMLFNTNPIYSTEIIIGTFGLESRYPFLDKNLWQESFYIKDSIKINENNNHKPVLHQYLQKNKFPFYDRDDNNNIIFYWLGLSNYKFLNTLNSPKSNVDWDYSKVKCF